MEFFDWEDFVSMKPGSRFFAVLFVLALSASPVFAALDDATAYYPLDKKTTSGSTSVDVSGDPQYNASVEGPTTGQNGLVRESYSFDGGNDGVRREAILDGSTFSTSLWFKSTVQPSEDQWLFHHGRRFTDTSYGIRQKDNGDLSYLIWGNSIDVSGLGYDDGDWHHAVITMDGSTLKAYFDGENVGSRSASINIDGSKQLLIGNKHNRPSNAFDGNIDEVGVWDRALTSSEVSELYNNGSGLNPYAQLSNFSVSAVDAFDNSSIQNISANLTGQTSGTTYDLNTSNGEIVSPVLSNSSEVWDVQVDSAGFESKTYQGLNVSQNTTLSARLRQAQSKFTTAFTKVSNDSLTDFNVTVEGQTFPSNSTFASPLEYNATFSKNGWYNKTEFYSQATLNQTFRDVYDHKLTIGAEEIRNGLTVNNFSGHIEAENYDYNESFNTFNTSSDTAQINLESNTTYTASITNTSDGFATRYQNGSLIMKEKFTTPANQSSSQLFKTYTYNSVEFNVEDVDTLNVLSQTTNISLINGPEDRELSNNNGSLFTDDLLTGSYTARITSNGFATQDYFFEVGESTFQELDVFLDDTTTQIFFTVRDSTRDPVSGAVMTMKTTLNGSTVTVGQKRTDFSGTASFLLNPEKTYSFTVQKPGFNTFEGEVTPSLTEYTVTITEGARDPYKSPREDYDFRTNVTVNNGTWTWEWNTISQNNKISSQNYSFTYNGTTYKGSSTNQAGAFFNETGGVVPIDNVLEVDYEVQTQSGIDQYTRRFSLRDTSTTLSGFLDIRDSSGPVTRAIIAFLVIAPLTVAATLASQSIAAGSLTAGALIGFFGFVGFLPVQTVIVVSTILTLTGVTIGVRQR